MLVRNLYKTGTEDSVQLIQLLFKTNLCCFQGDDIQTQKIINPKRTRFSDEPVDRQ